MSTAISSDAARRFAVIPAAGRSVRMGSPKLLLPWFHDDSRERTLIERVIGVWQSVGETVIVVTVHPDDAELAAVCRAAGAEVVQPAVPPVDMKASILAGLEYLQAKYAPAAADVWLTAPADLPELSPRVIERLLQTYDRSQPQILRPMHAGRYGHPTLLPWSLADRIRQIPADRGLDHLFEHAAFTAVEAGPACLADDVDTPADYRRLHDR